MTADAAAAPVVPAAGPVARSDPFPQLNLLLSRTPVADYKAVKFLGQVIYILYLLLYVLLV